MLRGGGVPVKRGQEIHENSGRRHGVHKGKVWRRAATKARAATARWTPSV